MFIACLQNLTLSYSVLYFSATLLNVTKTKQILEALHLIKVNADWDKRKCFQQ